MPRLLAALLGGFSALSGHSVGYLFPFVVSAVSHSGRAPLGPTERWTMFPFLCSRIGYRFRWRWWTLFTSGATAALVVVGCGGSDPDPDLVVLPPSSAEALAFPPVTSSPTAPPASEPLATVEAISTAAVPAPSTSASEIPIILGPDPIEESLPAPESETVPTPEIEPEPTLVSSVEIGTVPEPAEVVVTPAPDDHGHDHPESEPHPAPAPSPGATSSLPVPVGEPILLAENTEETFIDSGWTEARYQPIEIEVGTQIRAPDWEATSIVTRPPVDLDHNNLWDIYRCSVHEAYGTVNGWEFVTYAYRDADGRFRLVVGSARPVGPC